MGRRSPSSAGIAIIGMDCIFPGAADREAFWDNLVGGRDSITDVPAARWDPLFYDPQSTSVDRLYCRRGGFVDDHAKFDALRWGLMPVAVRGSEPDQMLALDVSARALADAGYDGPDRGFPRERTGVILGRGGYVNPGILRLVQFVRTSQELVASLRAAVPGVTDDELERVKREYQSRIHHVGPDTMIGLVPNLAASRIANRLDLHGPAYTVDAACASSLVAVHHACADLAEGRSDLILAGGVHLTQDVVFWSVFCQLGALSRSQQIRPFHREADGLLIGEGVGVVVLKRLADAERDGDRIYAVIRGCGVSSDGRESSVMTPHIRGQELALERAWQMAGLDPAAPGAVGLLEAHGTATPAGDAAEMETLARFFGPPRADEPRSGIGSVKSMIGHAMPAAGIAGLIKAALAIHRRQLLPTLHCEDPHPLMERTRFRPIHTAEPWGANGGHRRAGINAFGFGGINAHALIEEHAGESSRSTRSTRAAAPAPAGAALAIGARERALLWTAESPAELLAALDGSLEEPGDGPCRLVVLAPDAGKLERAREIIRRGAPFRDRRGEIWFAPRGLLTEGGGIVFLYPGVESVEGGDLEQAGAAVVDAGRELTAALGELGIAPDFVAGHSVGEWSAMIAAGAIPEDALSDLIAILEPGTLRTPAQAIFAAVGCGVDRVGAAREGLGGVHVALDNCPHQSVVCGDAAGVETLLSRLRADGVLCQLLPFRSGFHSPLFEDYVAPIRTVIEALRLAPPWCALWSATTCAPFPDDPDAMRRVFVEHLVRPVRFRELVERLHAAGGRAFVQVGAGSLPGFVNDTLNGRPHLAVSAGVLRPSGTAQLARVVAALWAEGAPVDWRRVLATHTAARRGSLRLALGAPLVSLETPLGCLDSGPDTAGDPVLAEFAATMAALEQSRREVLAAWRQRQSAPPPVPVRQARTRREISLASCPALLDHSFFNLPPGWPHPEDGFPLVPLTMSLSMMMEAAGELVPERTPIGLEGVRAYRWLVVENPVDLEIETRFDGVDRVTVRLGDYIQGTVVLATHYAAGPPASAVPLREEESVHITPAAMYEERLMFHGPRYRSVVRLEGQSPDGIRGVVECLPAEGSLLDGAGQLLGFWIRNQADRDRIALPVGLDAATFFGPHPAIGERLDCTVWIRRHGARQVRADLELSSEGRVWAQIKGWEDRRMESELWMWTAMQYPQLNLLAEPYPHLEGCCLTRQAFASSAARDFFARRYLDGTEIARYRALSQRRKSEWLAGRIAAKDAARRWLWGQGHGPIFPIEIAVHEDPVGRPTLRCSYADDLRVSIAHKGVTAVARVAQGHDVGIDLERIESRTSSFEESAFTAAERRLLPDVDRDEWQTRFWAAKEATAKRLGTGLGGDPRRFPISAVEGERVRVGECPVATRREGDMIIAWTEKE